MKLVRSSSKSSISTSRLSLLQILGCLLILAYVTSYVAWSRYAFAESREFGDTEWFHYFPVKYEIPFWIERAVQIFYAPMNFIDRKLFGAPPPGGMIDRSFSQGGYGTRQRFTAAFSLRVGAPSVRTSSLSVAVRVGRKVRAEKCHPKMAYTNGTVVSMKTSQLR